MARKRILGGLTLLLGILAVAWFLGLGRTRIGRGAIPQNVLLITLDTTRADHLGCYGYEPAKTPNLDGLAQKGVRFARVYCPGSADPAFPQPRS